MLSDRTLNRVSDSYRRGYRDGYAGNPPDNKKDPALMLAFSDFDYEAGYKGGANDAKWERLDREGKV